MMKEKKEGMERTFDNPMIMIKIKSSLLKSENERIRLNFSLSLHSSLSD